MSKEKRSFLERLTGAVRVKNEETEVKKPSSELESWMEEEAEDGELTVDVYQTPDMIVVKSMIAGVRPDDLDISITRDMITIRGHREEERTVDESNYLAKELYWGSFSRTIELPEEIDVDEAEAIEKHGLLILKLPKLDKRKQSKIKVRSGN